MPLSRQPINGFTLIEMSVVLVIIGLLLGAVVGGKALIKSAELQSIITDRAKYKAAVDTFKKQYNGLPGDIVDATEFWGVSSACGGASATGVCNGDGNQTLSYGAANAPAEAYQFWRQLALAGHITGIFSGTSGPISVSHSMPGTNVPAGRLSGSGWDAGSSSGIADTVFVGDYGNYLRIGKETSGSQVNTPLLSPEEAWKIDTKLDDGKPGRGTVLASNPLNACALAGSVNDLDEPYNLANGALQCTLFFVRQF